jgi:hypothetical protein
MPRDAGGSIEITEGTGPIRAMLSTGELLEMYKADKTFRIETPETIDPERTNPNAPFTVRTVQNVGTSNRIVARVLLQGVQLLNFALMPQDQMTAIRKQLHQCKELLLRAEASAAQVSSNIEAIEKQMRLAGINPTEPIPLKDGRVAKTPHVENLESDCSNFLVEVNRAIRVISALPSLFILLKKTDNNFDHLGKTLADEIGGDEVVTKFVKAAAGEVRHLVEMRNYLEHPNGKRTIINNFQLLPDGRLRPPTWHLSDEPPLPIARDMSAMIDLLIEVTEELLIHLVIYRGRERMIFSVQEITADQMDRDFPVKYKLVAYLKSLRQSEKPAP